MQARELRLPVVHDHRIADCHACELVGERARTECLSQRPKLFNGLMVIGEGPGVAEARLKTPFVGPSGHLLDALLKQAGLDRAETYVANATLCQPPPALEKKGFVDRHPTAVPSCLPRLLTEIRDVQPRVIVALGQAALTALTGMDHTKAVRVPFLCPSCGDPPKRAKSCPGCNGYKTQVQTITKFKSDETLGFVAGGVYDCEALELPAGKYMIPTYHPAFLKRQADTKGGKKIGGQFLASACLLHLMKAKFLLDNERVFRMTHKTTSDPDEFAAFTRRPGLYAVDIETDSKFTVGVTTIRCVGVSHVDSEEVLVADTDGLMPGHPLVDEVIGFLEDPTVQKSFQNGVYDTTICEHVWKADTQGVTFDTLVAHHVVAPDEPHDLHHIAFSYTDVAPWKPPKVKGGIEVFKTKEELHLYNARDTRVTALVTKSLQRELAREGVTNVHALDLAMFRVARDMRLAGVPFDMEGRERFAKYAEEQETKFLSAMRDLCGNQGLNPNKPSDLAWALHDPTGPFRLPVVSRSEKTKAPSVDKSARIKLLAMCAAGSGTQQAREFVEALTEWKRINKQRSTYITSALMQFDANNRVHPDWKPGEARTGRWSSSPNFQNFPKILQSLIMAPPGRAFTAADFAQLEMRIAGAVSGDKELIRRCMEADEHRKLEPDWDPHSYVSFHAFGTTFTKLLLKDPKHDESLVKRQLKCPCETCLRKQLREVAKMIFYALGYGAGWETIIENIYDKGYDGPALDERRVKGVIAAIFRAFPRFHAWREEQIRRVMREKKVYDPLLGRFRVFPLGEVESTIALNFPIQSCAASIMNLGTWDLYQKIEHIDVVAPRKGRKPPFIVAQIHDAIYVESDEEDAPLIAEYIESSLSCELVLIPGAPAMAFPAAAKIGRTFKEAG